MRTENEMIETILVKARNDDTIRAVIRTDFIPVREYLYNYNFYFVVTDIKKYDDDSIFEKCFGDRILLFRGDKNYPEMFPNTKAHLMVMRDGTTIAIHVMNRDSFLSRYNGEDTHENVWIGDTYKILLDKDDIFPEIERLEERQTLFDDKPTENQFLGACHEFWWVAKTFAEYTLREELLSAMFYLNDSVRVLLNQMLRWYIFLREGKPVDMGILDSNMETLLDKGLFALYKTTYPTSDYNSIWEAYDAVTKIWSVAGSKVAEYCGYDYPLQEEEDMRGFIYSLKDSKQI